MTDPTAAERARRYRARRRDRDANVTLRESGLEAVLGEVRDELRALREALPVLAERGYPQSAPNVDSRNVTGRHAVQRDVTERHATEGAPAPARVGARLSAPSGPREPLAVDRDDVTTEPRILELLAAVHEPASAGAIADALRLPTSMVVDELVALQRIGRVQRIAATQPGERDRWRLLGVADEGGETIRCSAYREHAREHRRDPASGRFRCFVCDPEYVAGLPVGMGGLT